LTVSRSNGRLKKGNVAKLPGISAVSAIRLAIQTIVHSMQINLPCPIPAFDQKDFSIVPINSAGFFFELLKDT